MKAEERKALEKNDLEAGLEKTLEGMRQGPPRSVVIGIVVVAVLVVLIFVWRWMSNSAAEQAARELVKLERVGDGTDIRELAKIVDFNTSLPGNPLPTDSQKQMVETVRRELAMVKQLQEMAGPNPRSLEGRLARLRLARLTLFLGERDATTAQRFLQQIARDNLELARKTYEELRPDCSDSPTLQQETLLNQGRASETLGDFDTAIKLYRQCAESKQLPDSPAVESARKHLERLESKAGRQQAEELYAKTLGLKIPG